MLKYLSTYLLISSFSVSNKSSKKVKEDTISVTIKPSLFFVKANINSSLLVHLNSFDLSLSCTVLAF
ncbi:hypothetical protein D3C81_553120 [compost metagenome]